MLFLGMDLRLNTDFNHMRSMAKDSANNADPTRNSIIPKSCKF